MVDEVLARQAAVRARRSGESLEDALDAVVRTEVGRPATGVARRATRLRESGRVARESRSFPSGGASRPSQRHEFWRRSPLGISVNTAGSLSYAGGPVRRTWCYRTGAERNVCG